MAYLKLWLPECRECGDVVDLVIGDPGQHVGKRGKRPLATKPTFPEVRQKPIPDAFLFDRSVCEIGDSPEQSIAKGPLLDS
jgi:hypothetical protein